jgi:HSP20 family protein
MLNTIFATDVRQTLDQFRRSVDQIFDNYYSQQTPSAGMSGATSERAWVFSPAFEHGWTDNHLNLRAILPGINPEDVRVTVQGNQLIVEGERKLPAGLKNHATQLPYGKFWASVTLPTGLDLEHVSCRLNAGILNIEVPVAETSKPQQIRIETGATEQKAIGV